MADERPYLTFGKDKYHLHLEMQEWCRQNIGPGGWLRDEYDLWNIESMFGTTTFTFKNDHDLTLFALKWQ